MPPPYLFDTLVELVLFLFGFVSIRMQHPPSSSFAPHLTQQQGGGGGFQLQFLLPCQMPVFHFLVGQIRPKRSLNDFTTNDALQLVRLRGSVAGVQASQTVVRLGHHGHQGVHHQQFLRCTQHNRCQKKNRRRRKRRVKRETKIKK